MAYRMGFSLLRQAADSVLRHFSSNLAGHEELGDAKKSLQINWGHNVGWTDGGGGGIMERVEIKKTTNMLVGSSDSGYEEPYEEGKFFIKSY